MKIFEKNLHIFSMLNTYCQIDKLKIVPRRLRLLFMIEIKDKRGWIIQAMRHFGNYYYYKTNNPECKELVKKIISSCIRIDCNYYNSLEF